MVNRLACLRGDAWSRLLEGLGLWWRALFASFRRPRAGEREQALLQFLKVSFLRDSLFQSATPQLEVLFSAAYHSIGTEELVTLVQQVRAQESALQHLRQAVQESLNLALLKTEVFAELSDVARALKSVAQRYFAQRSLALSPREIRAFVHCVPDEMEGLKERLARGLACCQSEAVRAVFLDQIECFSFAADGALRSPEELIQMVEALNLSMAEL